MPHTTPLREERANAASHALGLLLAAVALPLFAADLGWLPPPDSPRRIGLWVFGLSMALVFTASTLFHACPEGRWRDRLQRVDHAAIYLFMAGSYTPFALRELPGGPGWVAFGGVWVLATLGMAAKLLNHLRHRGLSTALYVGFGWVVGAATGPLLAHLPPTALTLVIAGGLAYTAGTLFYLLDRRWRWGHLVWHVFVLAGCACHGAAVLLALR